MGEVVPARGLVAGVNGVPQPYTAPGYSPGGVPQRIPLPATPAPPSIGDDLAHIRGWLDQRIREYEFHVEDPIIRAIESKILNEIRDKGIGVIGGGSIGFPGAGEVIEAIIAPDPLSSIPAREESIRQDLIDAGRLQLIWDEWVRLFHQQLARSEQPHNAGRQDP